MYQPTFGKVQQLQFNSEDEYYELLGFLSKGDGSTSIVWEDNDLQGAWEKEGRIIFHSPPPALLRAQLSYTEGGNYHSRVNCNEFILNLRRDHNFILGKTQTVADVRATVPVLYVDDFNRGLLL